MGENFRTEFNKSGIDNRRAAQIIPKNIFFRDRINNDILKTFREFEENVLK
jgi:hypothetical protein